MELRCSRQAGTYLVMRWGMTRDIRVGGQIIQSPFAPGTQRDAKTSHLADVAAEAAASVGGGELADSHLPLAAAEVKRRSDLAVFCSRVIWLGGWAG
jgi:hypothetical protein